WDDSVFGQGKFTGKGRTAQWEHQKKAVKKAKGRMKMTDLFQPAAAAKMDDLSDENPGEKDEI
ncbi:hypothetical protein DFQ28_009836, partial [Apophysomyces sp. BC1034]